MTTRSHRIAGGIAVALCAASVPAQTTLRVNPSCGDPSHGSQSAALTPDAHYVLFQSNAILNQFFPDTYQVYRLDRKTGVVSRVSVSSAGETGDSHSAFHGTAISVDGDVVAFSSLASNLVPLDENGVEDAFVHDNATALTRRVSVGPQGVEADGRSNEASLSSDGRFVCFSSAATNLVIDDSNGWRDVFVHDLAKGITTRVSVSSTGTEGDGDSLSRWISADGRFVAFESNASNLVPNDTNGTWDVFVHDVQTGETNRVSVDSSGNEGNGRSVGPSLSADGRFVAFDSAATNLVAGGTNGATHIFVHDRQSGVTSLVSRSTTSGAQGNSNSFQVWVSADGRFVTFASVASNLVPDDTNEVSDVFVHDRSTSRTSRVSVAAHGAQSLGDSSSPAISADGRFVAFHCRDGLLIPETPCGGMNVYVRYEPPCLGDANGDDVVNFTDLNWVLSQFGQAGLQAPWNMEGDVTGEGVVNFADLNIALSEFGSAC